MVRIVLREWESAGPGTGRAEALLRGVRLGSREAEAYADQLTQGGVLGIVQRADGVQIQARAHVGRIELGQLTVVVRPKLGDRQFLALLRYACGLDDLTRGLDTSLGEGGALPEDLLIAQLEVEVRHLLERGIARRYEGRYEALVSPRGRIDFAELARRPPRVRADLPCVHHLRQTDHLLNRVVLAGLVLARGQAVDPRTRREVARLHSTMRELATPVALNAELLSRAAQSVNRLVAPYESVLELIALLYQGRLLALESDRERRVLPGFLFDMNLFFQRLLLRFLREHLPKPWRIESEHSLSELFRYVPGENPRARTTPVPRPDYALWKGNQLVALLDAKYRDLWQLPLPREMLYQLSLYALSQPGRATATILYPSLDLDARSSRIAIRDPVCGGDAAYVGLRPVPVERLVDVLTRGDAAGGEKLAMELVGGEAGLATAVPVNW